MENGIMSGRQVRHIQVEVVRGEENMLVQRLRSRERVLIVSVEPRMLVRNLLLVEQELIVLGGHSMRVKVQRSREGLIAMLKRPMRVLM